MPFLLRLRALMAGAATFSFTAVGAAQEYPAKPVRLVVPNPAGGGNDLIGRIFATELSERLGKQVVVDNRGGAAGVIGTEAVANAASDGYTLLLASSNHVTNPWLYKISFDPLKSFAPVAMLASQPAVLSVHPSVAANSAAELIALAKAKPGHLNVAHGGAGGFQHLSWALFARQAGIDVVDVPFKGGGPAMINVLGGHSQILMSSYAQAGPHIVSGKLRALGIASAKRAAMLPNLPAIAEQGLPGFSALNWLAILAPAGTSKSISERLFNVVTQVQTSPEVVKRLNAEGAEPFQMSTVQLGQFVEAELNKWQQLIRSSGIKAE